MRQRRSRVVTADVISADFIVFDTDGELISSPRVIAEACGDVALRDSVLFHLEACGDVAVRDFSVCPFDTSRFVNSEPVTVSSASSMNLDSSLIVSGAVHSLVVVSGAVTGAAGFRAGPWGAVGMTPSAPIFATNEKPRDRFDSDLCLSTVRSDTPGDMPEGRKDPPRGVCCGAAGGACGAAGGACGARVPTGTDASSPNGATISCCFVYSVGMAVTANIGEARGEPPWNLYFKEVRGEPPWSGRGGSCVVNPCETFSAGFRGAVV